MKQDRPEGFFVTKGSQQSPNSLRFLKRDARQHAKIETGMETDRPYELKRNTTPYGTVAHRCRDKFRRGRNEEVFHILH